LSARLVICTHPRRIWSLTASQDSLRFIVTKDTGTGLAGDRTRALHALRSRDFRLFFSGQAVSLVGNAAFTVALGWRTYTLTGQASSLGYVLAAQALATVATLLIGGVLADRYDRRRLMIASDVGRFLAVAVLAGLDATGHLSFDLLLTFAVLVGLGEGFFIPAFGGMVPLVVESPLLASANALVGIARQGSSLIGPGIAAALYAPAGSAAVFALDAASFLVASACCCSPARAACPPPRARAPAASSPRGSATWRASRSSESRSPRLRCS